MNAKETEGRVSIVELANKSIEERINYEVPKIIDNIQDLNTRADKKRTLTITMDFIPNMDRTRVVLNTVIKSKLEPTSPIQTSLAIGPDANGEIIAVELVSELPGQRSLFGTEQEQPKVLKMVR